jgi:hypothetical protein
VGDFRCSRAHSAYSATAPGSPPGANRSLPLLI